MRPLRLRRPERVLAWVITGPIGHLVAGLIDLASVVIRVAWARARGREL